MTFELWAALAVIAGLAFWFIAGQVIAAHKVKLEFDQTMKGYRKQIEEAKQARQIMADAHARCEQRAISLGDEYAKKFD